MDRTVGGDRSEGCTLNCEFVSTFLGLDAGGTRTRWVLLDAQERVLTSGETAPIQAAVQGVDAAAEALAGALAEILAAIDPGQRPGVTVAGVAGAGAVAVRHALAAAAPVPLHVTGDAALVAALALADTPGVAVWSGTGSFVIARDDEGRLHRAGGRGPLLGDEGSGYDVVRRAAVAVVRAIDGVGLKTALAPALADFFDVEEPAHLGACMQRLSSGRVAAAMPLVAEIADTGDPVAARVIEQAAQELVALAVSIAARAGLSVERDYICFGGGAVRCVPRYARCLQDVLVAAGFRAPQLAGDDPAIGAARLARAIDAHREPLCEWVGA